VERKTTYPEVANLKMISTMDIIDLCNGSGRENPSKRFTGNWENANV